jgi:hypothetical protein
VSSELNLLKFPTQYFVLIKIARKVGQKSAISTASGISINARLNFLAVIWGPKVTIRTQTKLSSQFRLAARECIEHSILLDPFLEVLSQGNLRQFRL